MIFDGVELKTKTGSTNINTREITETIHIPFTDINKKIKKGKKPTIITSKIICMTETETNNTLLLLNTSNAVVVQIGNKLFKDVSIADECTPVPKKKDKKGVWYIGIKLEALDPLIYNAGTGDAIYD